MIFKELGEDTETQIKLLKNLLKQSNNVNQKKLIQENLTKIENGYISEKENAYYLDFHLGNSKNHILLHNLRFEYNNRVAQVDHILINRMGVTLLESKSFKGLLEIKDDGSLSVDYKKYIQTFPNPVEQNYRHQLVVAELINDSFNLPANIKAFGGLKFYTKVLINPKTSLKNKKLPNGYERADKYTTARLNEIDNMNPITVIKTASTMLTIDKAKELAKFLMKNHKPLTYDYSKKYPIKSTASSYIKEKPITYNKSQNNLITYTCTKCKSKNLEVAYGRNYYFKCLDCENNIPIKHTCNTPNCKPKTRKSKLQFFKVCEACSIDELFWENKP